MKKAFTLCVGIACAMSLSAQKQAPVEIHYPDGSLYKECYYVRETKPLKEILADRKAKGLDILKKHDGPAVDGRAAEEFAKKKRQHAPGNPTPDEALQSEQGHLISSTIQNFEGQPCYGGYPLDPNGMIGSNYYVQTINSSFEAWDKSGTVYIPQTDLYSLFGSEGSCDCGDPVTLYDKMADRWVISELEGGVTNSNYDTLLIAVSQSNDPAGAYWIYAFDPYANDFDDYPKYTVWGNGYYMTCNCNNPDMVVSYQRDSMLKGAKAAFIAMPWNYGPTISGCEGNFFCPQLLDCDGVLPPANAPEYLFYYWEQDWGCGGGADSIIIEQITVNWATKKGTINAKFQHLVVTNFNSNFPADFDANLPQPGNNSSDYVASGDGFFAYRIPYLRWPSYNSAVMCFPVNPSGSLSAPVSCIRWYELHQDTTTKLWSAYQQSTYGPNDGISRWNGSIAMDMNGDIGLEYSVTSPGTVYPGIRYTGRRYCDLINTMTLAEGTAATGNALANTPQGNGNRWGDYSHLSVDPIDGKTFWGTNMYAENGIPHNVSTRVFSFQVPICSTDVPEVVNSNNASLKAYQNGSNLNIAGTDFPQNERLVIQLFDVNGRMLMQKDMQINTTTLETSFNISSLAKGIYLVRVGNDHIQRVLKVAIN